MILSGYPNVTGEFLFRNKQAYPGLSAHSTESDTVEIWGPDGAAVPTIAEILAWKDSPQTRARKMSEAFREARQAAPELLDQLKGAVGSALVESGMSEVEATAAVVSLVMRFGSDLATFVNADGHPIAAKALFSAISSPDSIKALPWLNQRILAILADKLLASSR